MQNHQTVLSTFQFKRIADVIRVFNENSYFMAEYSERTGSVKWQRVLIASQRELIEKWLRERYPAAGTAVKAREIPTPPAVRTAPPAPRTAVVHRPSPVSARGNRQRRAVKST
jgi:hypothetical protein